MKLIDFLGIIGITSISSGVIWKVFIESSIQETISSFYQKKLENHKFLLKNSERVFQFKLDASKELYKISQEMTPINTHPDMEWGEACEQIAMSFEYYQSKLTNFMCEYHATLSTDLYKRINIALDACASGISGVYFESTGQPPIVNEESSKKAGELYDAINEAVDMLRVEVQQMIVSKT